MFAKKRFIIANPNRASRFTVFSVALSLALGALSPTSPVASVTSGAAVATCFAPEENCTAFAVDAIDAAEHQILANAYGLTTQGWTPLKQAFPFNPMRLHRVRARPAPRKNTRRDSRSGCFHGADEGPQRGMRSFAADFDGRLILALAQIDDMSQQPVRRPFGVADLDDHLGGPNAPG
jgi:hypothetical protein